MSFERRRMVAEDLWVSVYLYCLNTGNSHGAAEAQAKAAVDAFVARFSDL